MKVASLQREMMECPAKSAHNNITAKTDFTFSNSSTLWHWGKQTLIMGIINCTPDSFTDGGEYFDLKCALQRVKVLYCLLISAPVNSRFDFAQIFSFGFNFMCV